MCDVSIVIVSWNAREHLRGCLRSLDQGLERHSHEVIVVDNASADGSAEAVAEGWPGVRLIRAGANLGFARATNIGIRSSRGCYVCLVNSDVTVLPGCIDMLIDLLEERRELGMAGPRVLNTDGTVQPSRWDFPTVGGALRRTLALDTLVDTLGRRFFAPSRPDDDSRPPVCPAQVLSGCFLLLRRVALDQVGLLDEQYFMYGEDMDLCRRFHQAGWGIATCAAARAIHAGGASSANAPVRFYLELQKANLRYWDKHHGAWGRAFYLANLLAHHLLRLIPLGMMYLLLPSRRERLRPKIERAAACIRWILSSRPRLLDVAQSATANQGGLARSGPR